MVKRFTIYLILFLATVGAKAEETKFTMSAPNAVEMGQQFRLTFSLNEQGQNLKLPSGLSDNFEILMGPSTGYSSSTQIINGRSSTQVSYTYTYILRARKEGTFEIRSASVEVGGKVYESNSINVQVVKAQSQPAQAQSNNNSESSTETARIDKEDIFVRVEMNKRNVYRGEQIISEVKLYVNPNIPIARFDEVNLPSYEGFYTQDIDIPQQINFTREVYNNKIYQVGILKKTVLFPQQNGKITVQPFNMSLIVQQRTESRSFFDDFFNNYRNVRVSLTSDPVSVNVKDLPPAPANFKGGIGNFNVTSSISSENVTSNDAVTLTLKISGTGNIRLIQTPELQLPSDFEVYDPKVNDKVTANDNGVSGTKTIDFLTDKIF